MARKLKVFRTPIGFHDAYVASPSRKAALAAWGTDRDLFARGAAEEVHDAALSREPLANPGQIIRVSRGSDAEHLAVAAQRSAPDRTRAQRQGVSSPAPRAKPKDGAGSKRRPKPKKLKPRPPRDRLQAADEAIARAEQERSVALDAFRVRAEALARERRQYEAKQEARLRKLKIKRDREAASYERRLEKWRTQSE